VAARPRLPQDTIVVNICNCCRLKLMAFDVVN
jgi:hypothetical protein